MSTRLSFAAVALLAAAAAATATTSMHGAERVSIRVTPGISFAPADVTINAIVEPNAANRAIEVVVDSGELLPSQRGWARGRSRAARESVPLPTAARRRVSDPRRREGRVRARSAERRSLKSRGDADHEAPSR